MFQIHSFKRSAMVIATLISLPCVICAEVTSEDSTKKDSDEVVARRAAYEKHLIETLEQESNAAAGSGVRTQTYRFRVIDQHGKPAAGIPIAVTSSVRRANFVSSGFLSDSVREELFSDEWGELLVKPAVFHKLSIGVMIGTKDIVNVFREGDKIDGRQQQTGFSESEVGLAKLNADGYHAIFHVHRYGDRDPLGLIRHTFRIPLNDRDPYAVWMFAPPGKKRHGKLAEWEGMYDFSITVNRPDVPYWNEKTKLDALGEVIPGQYAQVSMPPFSIVLRGQRGGFLRPIQKSKSEYIVPLDGYSREMVWNKKTPEPGSNYSAYSEFGPALFRSDTNPVFYGLFNLDVLWRRDYSVKDPKSFYSEISFDFFVNLKKNRSFEFAEEGRFPPWLGGLKDEEYESWLTLPLKPGAAEHDLPSITISP